MNYGFCPSCANQLTDGSVLKTGQSKIFKGNNVYIMCKNCQRVMMYNVSRDLMFDLDDYKDDAEVLQEVDKLLSEIDDNYEVAVPCSGNCSECSGCAVEPEPETSYQRRPARQTKQESSEPVVEEKESSSSTPESVIKSTLTNGFLAVNKEDPTVKLIIVDKCDLDDINVDEWVFFEMSPIEITVRKSYEIKRC
jgi:hypothetical protein